MSPEEEGRIQLALRAYETRQFRSIRKAAVAYNVNHATLTRRANGITFRPEIQPNSRKLTETEEQTIVRYILDLDSRGFAPRLYKIEDIVNKILALCIEEYISKY